MLIVINMTNQLFMTKMRFIKRYLIFIGLTVLMQQAVFAQSNNGFKRQSVNKITEAVAQFLEQQVLGYPGQPSIRVGQIDPNIKLSSCETLEAFLPTGSKAWGKTSVGVRCNGAARWTIYVQADVSVHAQYIVAAAPLLQGTTIGDEHLTFATGDLTQLPAGIFTESQQAVGRIVNMSVPAGTVLRQNILKRAPVVQRGQTVILTSSGKGFKVAAEGKSLGNAVEGQVVQVKVASGQVVAGIAQENGQIEIKF